MSLFVVEGLEEIPKDIPKILPESSLSMLADKSDYANGLCIFPEIPEYRQQ